MIQKAVCEIWKLSPLPSEEVDSIDYKKIALLDELEAKIAMISTPISDEDALMLIKCFGPDECFGLAWQIIHSIETAPSWPMLDVLREMHGYCIDLMKARCIKSGFRI